jgi:hypothetical protein
MPTRSLAFAIVMICISSGWTTAHAQARIPPNTTKNAAKLVGEGATHAKSYFYTLEGWKVIPHDIGFDLPFRGRFNLPSVDLKWPVGGTICYIGCKGFVEWAHSLAQPRPVAGPTKESAEASDKPL